MQQRHHADIIRRSAYRTREQIRRHPSNRSRIHTETHCSKCANAYAVATLSDYLQPIQVGVGTPGGCEAAVHSTMRFMENMPDDYCIFNSLHRYAMLKTVLERMSGIYKFCHLAYDRSSVFSYNGRTVFSSEGPQQGDPLGASLFCATIHPLLSSLTSITRLVHG